MSITKIYKRNLPHIHPEKGIFFITFRLAGTIPKSVLLDLLEKRKSELEKLLDFLQLTSYDDFFQNLPNMKNMNKKWRETLTDNEIQIISKTLNDTVSKLGLPYDMDDQNPLDRYSS